MLQESAIEDEDSECVMGGAVADSVVGEHELSSVKGPGGRSMPVLMGDSWPFRGWRRAVEDGVEAKAGAGAVLVLADVTGSIWWWCRASSHGGDCGRSIECWTSESKPPTIFESDQDKILSSAARRSEWSITRGRTGDGAYQQTAGSYGGPNWDEMIEEDGWRHRRRERKGDRKRK